MNKRRPSTRAEIIIAIFTIVIAALYVASNCFLYRQIRITESQLAILEAGQRPYVGISEIRVEEANGTAKILAVLKNFGQVPAFKFSADWEPSINGFPPTPQAEHGPPRPFTLYPGANQALGLSISEPKWSGIASGRDTLRLRVGTSYRGPTEGQKYGECEEREYDRTLKAFRVLGTCSPSPK